MKWSRRKLGAALAPLAIVLLVDASLARSDAPSLYREHCAACHGADRLGAIGPALLPGNLKRLKQATYLPFHLGRLLR